jgi:hypothetical protein
MRINQNKIQPRVDPARQGCNPRSAAVSERPAAANANGNSPSRLLRLVLRPQSRSKKFAQPATTFTDGNTVTKLLFAGRWFERHKKRTASLKSVFIRVHPCFFGELKHD